MKVYGFNDADIFQGEMRATTADPDELEWGEQLTVHLGWEFVSRKFAEAKVQLICRMQAEGVDQEMVDVVRRFKASYILVDER